MPRQERRSHLSTVEGPSDEDAPPAEEEEDEDEGDNSQDDVADDGEGIGSQNQDVNLEQLVKKMVRYAIVCEYSRTPIRRTEIGEKVLSPHRRKFNAVFEGAQKELRAKFGMQMELLPSKEKVTIAQRRAAQKVDRPQTTSKTWVLVSILPPQFRVPEILQPPQVPTMAMESAYIGLYSFVISIISLSGGSCPESKMERYLRRTNADQYTIVDRTDKLFARMIKEGYIVKIKDSAGGGDDQAEYMVGPRGKVEIGPGGVKGLVQAVYQDGEVEDLDSRVAKSLGLQTQERGQAPEEAGLSNSAGTPRQDEAQGGRSSGRKRRTRDDDDD